MKENNTTETTKTPAAIVRIGKQVEHLIMPDFRPLAKVLQDKLINTARQRDDIARDIEEIEAKAMAAATQLMLINNADWQERPATHMGRVKQLRGKTYE